MPKQPNQISTTNTNPPLQRCRYCDRDISERATVCHHCSRPQHPIRNFVEHSGLLSNIISIGILLVSIWQLAQALEERADATEAYSRAQIALEKAVSTEAKILEARHDILEVSEGLIEIAEMIPTVTGFGSGPTNEDRAKLKRRASILKSRLQEVKKLIN